MALGLRRLTLDVPEPQQAIARHCLSVFRAHMPSGFDLRGASLRGANLIGANLEGADLRGALLARRALPWRSANYAQFLAIPGPDFGPETTDFASGRITRGSRRFSRLRFMYAIWPW